ncbi:MAG: Hpt domain-containing protein [Roseinatronobacter sp.]|nr:Hpt domain-containing protein [Roseinatronobacter sp.]
MSDEMDEIWVLYADDGAQAMDAMETALLELQGSGAAEQPPLVAALFRAVHTFKGNSRVLGLETVESRAHLAEDLIGLVRDKGVDLDEEILSLLLETGDRLREMLEETARTRADVAPADTEALVARLRDKIARCGDGPAEGGAAETGPDMPDPRTLASTPEPQQPPAPASETEVISAPPASEMAIIPAPEAAPPPQRPETMAPLAEQAPSPAPAIAPAGASQPTATSGPTLAQDATYLAIFNEMVTDALTKLRKAHSAADAGLAKRIVPGLAHAARQLGLQDWQDLIATLPQAPSVAEIETVIFAIESMGGPQAASAVPCATEEDAQATFFERIAPPLEMISRFGTEYTLGNPTDPQALAEAVQALSDASEAVGFVRVTSAARTLPAASDAADFRRSELRLYEELASVEMALGEKVQIKGTSPRTLLQTWCADHAFETLDELDAVLERLRRGSESRSDHRALERLIRLVHHACVHFSLHVASDLAMSILDLFSRGHARGDRPDAILMQIARGFIDTLELVFDSVREGETPNTERLEELFRQAADAGFKGAGTMTAATVERRLGLPDAFHRVLSPESTRAAGVALEQGKKFYLLRADINSDDRLAEALFELIGSGTVEAITNVTVFDGDNTIFDFLLASDHDEVAMVATFAQLDPSGKKLALLQHLRPEHGTEESDATPSAGDDGSADVIPSAEMSSEMLEQLGEVAAGQAMLQNMLGDLCEADLSETMDTILRQHGHDLRATRQALRATANQLTDQLREISQLGTQIMGHLSELQHLTAALRTRPADTILRPLTALVATQSRKNGFEALLTTTGGDEALDVRMLNTLRALLRPYLQARLSQPTKAPRRLHLAIRKLEDQVSAILQDDGSTTPAADHIAAMEEELSVHGGALRVIKRPEGGFRLHIFLPINLVVLDGMVVGAEGTRYVLPVNAIRSILQPEPSALIHVSDPAGQQIWLRLSSEELIPICDISGHKPGRGTVRKHAADGKERIHVVLNLPNSCIAVPVDELLGQQLVLSRPLRGVMTGLSSISGVALLSRGDVAMVLSPGALCGGVTGDEFFRSQISH